MKPCPQVTEYSQPRQHKFMTMMAYTRTLVLSLIPRKSECLLGIYACASSCSCFCICFVFLLGRLCFKSMCFCCSSFFLCPLLALRLYSCFHFTCFWLSRAFILQMLRKLLPLLVIRANYLLLSVHFFLCFISFCLSDHFLSFVALLGPIAIAAKSFGLSITHSNSSLCVLYISYEQNASQFSYKILNNLDLTFWYLFFVIFITKKGQFASITHIRK